MSLKWSMAVAAGVAVSAVSPERVSAQVPVDMQGVDSGLVVRAWLDSGQLRGRLLQPMHAGADSVGYCRFPGPPCDGAFAASQAAWLHLDRVQHLDVQVGNRWKKGAWIGGISGALFGVLAAGLATSFCDNSCHVSRGEATLYGLVAGGAMHGVIGALIGSTFPRFERRF